MTQFHAHDSYEIYFLLSGSCSFFMNHTLYAAVPGNAMLIPPSQLHRFTYDRQSERYAITFTLKDLSFLQPDYDIQDLLKVFRQPVLQITDDLSKEILYSLDRLYASQNSRCDMHALSMRIALVEVLLKLKQVPYTASSVSSKNFNLPLQKAAQYIFVHYSEDITLSKAADIAGMSPYYFSRRFQKTTGFGFREYLNHVRIMNASLLLKNTHMSVTEIAMHCGFSNSNYFAADFKQISGVSPLTFRKMHHSTD